VEKHAGGQSDRYSFLLNNLILFFQGEKRFYLDKAKVLKDNFHERYPDYIYRRKPGKKKRRGSLPGSIDHDGDNVPPALNRNALGFDTGGESPSFVYFTKFVANLTLSLSALSPTLPTSPPPFSSFSPSQPLTSLWSPTYPPPQRNTSPHSPHPHPAPPPLDAHLARRTQSLDSLMSSASTFSGFALPPINFAPGHGGSGPSASSISHPISPYTSYGFHPSPPVASHHHHQGSQLSPSQSLPPIGHFSSHPLGPPVPQQSSPYGNYQPSSPNQMMVSGSGLGFPTSGSGGISQSPTPSPRIGAVLSIGDHKQRSNEDEHKDKD
jgi:hypothetical protein